MKYIDFNLIEPSILDNILEATGEDNIIVVGPDGEPYLERFGYLSEVKANKFIEAGTTIEVLNTSLDLVSNGLSDDMIIDPDRHELLVNGTPENWEKITDTQIKLEIDIYEGAIIQVQRK